MQKLIVGNLKMNIVSNAEKERYFQSFESEKALIKGDVVLCPPALHLEAFAKNFAAKKIAFGAQNIFWEDRGSYTGEISASMVKNLGAQFVIVGHSERRRYFGETNEQANLKIKAALRNDLFAIYCVGETLEEKEAEQTGEVIVGQIKNGLAEVELADPQRLVIAYEPVWAIGGSTTPKSDEILEVKILIKKLLTERFGQQAAEKIRILYGGSVNVGTAKQVCSEPGMDGVLVGRESLIPQEFIKISNIINENK